MYEVDFENGRVLKRGITQKGLRYAYVFKLYTDIKGVHIITKNGTVYLTEENARVL